MSKLIDITPRIDPDTAVWPGDTGYSVKWVMRMDEGGPCNTATVTTTVHVGAHADGPYHFDSGSPEVADLDLDPYLGPCRVVDLTGAGVVDREALFGVELYGVERVLFRTGTFPDATSWNDDFAYLDPSLVRELGKMGVKLVGIDTPSVDPYHSKTLPSHHALLELGMRNLEGLDLGEVPAGDYELIALPLRLGGVDSSPVRAVLRTLPARAGS
jgi:arylformamidase